VGKQADEHLRGAKQRWSEVNVQH